MTSGYIMNFFLITEKTIEERKLHEAVKNRAWHYNIEPFVINGVYKGVVSVCMNEA